VYKSVLNTVYDKTLRTISVPSEETIQGIIRDRVSNTVVQTYRDGFYWGMKDVEARYGRSLPLPVGKAFGIKTAVVKEVTRENLLALGLPSNKVILEQVGMRKIKTISSSLHGELKKQFDEAISAGEAQPKLIERIKHIQEQADWKARRIAQTECTRIYNGGSLEAYKQSKVSRSKKWVINFQGNVRPAHMAASGQTVPVDQPFIVMGEKLMYPGDDAGSAENTVNCHCGLMPVIGKIHPVQPKPRLVTPRPER
jgi:hypothetical protein